ncbi:hypothetical protein Tco_0152879 [Tanacetum coccineum]
MYRKEADKKAGCSDGKGRRYEKGGIVAIVEGEAHSGLGLRGGLLGMQTQSYIGRIIISKLTYKLGGLLLLSPIGFRMESQLGLYVRLGEMMGLGYPTFGIRAKVTLNIEKLDGNIIQNHGGSKQVGFKQLGSKQVGFKQLDHKQVGFKQLGPGVETGVHGVRDEKRVWFEVELRLGDNQPEEKTNTDCLVKKREKVHLGIKVGANITITGVPGKEGAEGNVAEKKKVKESMKANLRKLLKYNA